MLIFFNVHIFLKALTFDHKGDVISALWVGGCFCDPPPSLGIVLHCKPHCAMSACLILTQTALHCKSVEGTLCIVMRFKGPWQIINIWWAEDEQRSFIWRWNSRACGLDHNLLDTLQNNSLGNFLAFKRLQSDGKLVNRQTLPGPNQRPNETLILAYQTNLLQGYYKTPTHQVRKMKTS